MEPIVKLSHSEATFLFALFSSVILGVVSKKTDKERLRYGLTAFGWYAVTVFGLGWLMYFAHR